MVRLFTRQQHGRHDADAWVPLHRSSHVTDRVGREHDVAVEQKNVIGSPIERGADADVASAREAGVDGRFDDANAFERSPQPAGRVISGSVIDNEDLGRASAGRLQRSHGKPRLLRCSIVEDDGGREDWQTRIAGRGSRFVDV